MEKDYDFQLNITVFNKELSYWRIEQINLQIRLGMCGILLLGYATLDDSKNRTNEVPVWIKAKNIETFPSYPAVSADVVNYIKSDSRFSGATF